MADNVAGVTLYDILYNARFRAVREAMENGYDKGQKNKWEYYGVVFINATTGDIKIRGPKTDQSKDSSSPSQIASVPDGYDQLLLNWHTHVGNSVAAGAPSGISDGKGDMAHAKSEPWNQSYSLVLTNLKDPVKERDTDGKCEVVFKGNTGTWDYRTWVVNPE